MEFKGKKNIIWDFDGVLIDSMAIREKGFREVLEIFPEREVELLLQYHRKNGGLSRYVKFEYFFKDIRKQSVSRVQMVAYANEFSRIMREHLVNREFLIRDSLHFVQKNNRRYNMHIVSGSDDLELKYLCEQLGLNRFFISIEGSPTPKVQLVEELLRKQQYIPQETILIGDSINDYEAAELNRVDFYGYNNGKLQGIGKGYITSFNKVE